MNKIILLFILVSNFTFSQTEKTDSKFKITYDTIQFNSVSEALYILRDRNRFYMFSEQNIQPYSTKNIMFLKILKNNRFEFESRIPDSLNTTYIDLFKRNDSLIYKKYLDNKTYYLNQNYNWKNINKTDDLVYEDKDFYVTSLDFGEFGQRTWFKNKKTKKEYSVDLFTYIINKLNGEYYLTTTKNIYKISNPKKLRKTPQNESYVIYKNTNKNPYDYLKPVVLDSVFSSNKKGFYITTSFIAQDRLFHICRDENKTYIAEIKNSKMNILQNLPDDIISFRRYFSYRNKIQNNQQTIQFKTKSSNLSGIIEIDKGNISLIYFNNNYKLQYLGYDIARINLENKIDYLFDNIGKSNLSEIAIYEEKSTPIPINHSMRLEYKGKLNQDFRGPKIYKVIEDNYFELHTLYSYNEDEEIEGVTFSWNRNLDYEQKTKTIDEKLQNEGKAKRYENIKNYLISKFGLPNSEIGDKENNKNIWKIGEKTIQLNRGKYYLELKLFKN